MHCIAMEAFLIAVQSGECDIIDEWVGLQCLMEGGVCDECVMLGLQRFFLNSSETSCGQGAGLGMQPLKLSARPDTPR